MIHLKLTATCDTCGAVIGEQEHKGTQEGFAEAMSRLKRAWRKERVLIADRAYRPTKHYCQPCADGRPVTTANV